MILSTPPSARPSRLPGDGELGRALDARDRDAGVDADAPLLERAGDDVAGVDVGGARMRGSASMIVTSLPMSASIDANSQPITPPPMIATRGRELGRARARGPTTARACRRSRGRGASAATSRWRSPACALDLGAVGDAARGGAAASTSSPRRSNTVTLRPLSSVSRPLVSRSTTCCLRACDWAEVERRATRRRRRTPAPLTVRSTSAVCEQLLGRDAAPVQAGAADPVLLDHRDVEPAAAPYRAAAYPAGPPPRTTTSNCSARTATSSVDGHRYAPVVNREPAILPGEPRSIIPSTFTDHSARP